MKPVNSLRNKIKYLFVAMGPGETGQARSLAKYISQKNGEIVFALRPEKILRFFAKDKEFRVFLAETPEKLKEIVEKEKPDVLLLFNSKMWTSRDNFLEIPPFEKPPLCLAVDSNWLFNDEKYPSFRFIKWANKYLVLFPKRIFELGLKENNGAFVISPDVLKKIIPVGLIPTYKKPAKKEISAKRKEYGVKSGEKFIFSYFSGFGASHRIWAFYNLIKAVDKLIAAGKKIKVLYTGPTEGLEEKFLSRNWLIKKTGLSSEEYFLTLASGDLVFQHQGMVTLSQAISANIPTIANVSLLPRQKTAKLHFWEVSPFARTGVCSMLAKSAPTKIVAETIENLLYNDAAIKKMIEKQKEIFQRGEPTAHEIIIKLLKRSPEIASKKI